MTLRYSNIESSGLQIASRFRVECDDPACKMRGHADYVNEAEQAAVRMARMFPGSTVAVLERINDTLHYRAYRAYKLEVKYHD